MPPTRNILVAILTRAGVSVALVLMAAAIYGALYATRPQPATTDSQREPAPVLVMPVESTPVRRQWTGYGTAQPLKSADVPARVTATVVTRPDEIRPGRAVNAGDLIVQLDDSDFARQVEITTQTIAELQAQLDRLDVEQASWTRRVALLEEELRLAQAEFDRAMEAFEREAAKQREVDLIRQNAVAAERALVAAEEELNQIPLRRAGLTALREGQEVSRRLAQQNVERSRIIAPISGVLQFVDIDEGENVAAGQRVARIVSLDRIEVPLRLPASARVLVAAGDTVQLHSTGALEQQWPATITRIAPEDDPDTRTFEVFVELNQADVLRLGDAATPGPLAPGQFVRGVVQSSRVELRTVLPRRALQGDRVMIVADGVIATRTVTIDFQLEGERAETHLPDRQWVVIGESLPEGTLVVINAGRTLATGSVVQPVLAGPIPEENSDSITTNRGNGVGSTGPSDTTSLSRSSSRAGQDSNSTSSDPSSRKSSP